MPVRAALALLAVYALLLQSLLSLAAAGVPSVLTGPDCRAEANAAAGRPSAPGRMPTHLSDCCTPATPPGIGLPPVPTGLVRPHRPFARIAYRSGLADAPVPAARGLPRARAPPVA